ncbi:MAG TPA: hypothetical protein VJ463_05820, partial [Geothrix sp.]|nr:hypothetical protein [Geothrix sp.]
MSEAAVERMTGPELVALVRRVFQPRPEEGAVAILVDLPDARVPDDANWKARREIAADWAADLAAHRADLGLDTHLVLYPNVHTNNGELPERAWIHGGGPLPSAE